MQDTFNTFFNQYNNQNKVGDTPENTGECVGLVQKYTDFLGLPHTWGNAYDLYDNADVNHFYKILNTQEAIPEVGDIVIWSGDFNGGVGHCGIATANANLNTVDIFEQNDPLGSNCHVKTYSYQYIKGWLRPITSTQTDELTACLADREKFWKERDILQAKLNSLQSSIDDYKKNHPDNITVNTNPIVTVSNPPAKVTDIQPNANSPLNQLFFGRFYLFLKEFFNSANY